MFKIKLVVLCGVLAGIAIIFQTAPVFLTELFLPVTILSTFPVNIASRINPLAGICTFISAALLIFLVSMHEGFFFICTNGITGLSLGVCRYYTDRKSLITLVTSLVLSFTLCFANFIIGVAVFGTKIPGSLFICVTIILIFASIYGFIIMNISDFLFKKLKKIISI